MMSVYVPGTLDDMSVIKREIAELKRQIRESNVPSKTQTYATTDKISGDTQDLSEIYQRLGIVETKTTTLTKEIEKVQQIAEKARMPIGSFVYMASKSPPSLYGTWTYDGEQDIITKDQKTITMYLYKRTS